jgi:hypothetical protein
MMTLIAPSRQTVSTLARLRYEHAPRANVGDVKPVQPVVALAPAAPTDLTPDAATRQSAWTDVELDESILFLCEEFPHARLAECSRALEHCRRSTPRGTRLSLLVAMRESLRRQITAPRFYAAAA